ncbi:hypothetical protein Dsin_013563 [Dipteronia sinensis]|uniref:Reverse transcriptase domain-containing protein n=1 Tax=Dipteronia sinensis TaxID=43782 RepID=A0AAE0E900_9ROSI|nr:hypothetical protein Dsin_013563 [Dipteronia sinensis]
MRNFKMIVEAANVIDLPLHGMAFTWSNNKEDESWARLDRFLCDPLFISWFPQLVQKGLGKSLPDHNPIFLGESEVDWGPKPFWFLNGWLEDKVLLEGVRNCWLSCQAGASVGLLLKNKIRAVRSHLKAYSKTNKLDGDMIKALEEELARIEGYVVASGWTVGLREQKPSCLVKLRKQIRLDEQKWRQISKERMKLEVEFLKDEVWKALSECDGNKAPGSDGLNLNFIKANWELIKGDFMNFLHTFYHDGSVIKDFNCTFIALIPKIKILVSLQDFRHISLVLVNGCPTKQFSMEKGLRQGDPLSPFLFNIVVEVLSCMLNKVKQLDMLNGAVFGNGAVHISHLQFANDTILFLEPKLEYLMNTKRILRCLELVSGLKINFHKSCLVRVSKKGAQEDDWAGKFRINKFFCENQRAYNIVKKGFQVVIGNEEKIRFWQEVKWDSVPLMNAFPRIFALATNKSGVIFELSSWVDSKWAWDVNLRRALFNWELDQWNCFKMCLENIKLRVGIPNALAWSHCSNGIFSVSSFRRCLEDNNVCTDCPLCGGGSESIDHLFLHYVQSDEIWRTCMGWWGISSCASPSVKEWATCWNHFCPSALRKKAWNTLFFAVIWSIWECRNDMVFGGKNLELGLILDMIKFCVALWFKNHGRGSNVDLTLLILDLNDRCVDVSVAKARRASIRHPPTVFELCFNVDGLVRGSPGEAGIGVVLRDSSGRILCLFSLYLVHLVYDIHLFLKSSDGFDLRYMPRESNSMAESLAKAGSSGGRDRLEWEDV